MGIHTTTTLNQTPMSIQPGQEPKEGYQDTCMVAGHRRCLRQSPSLDGEVFRFGFALVREPLIASLRLSEPACILRSSGSTKWHRGYALLHTRAYGEWLRQGAYRRQISQKSLVFGLWSLVFGLWSLVFGLWSFGEP